MQDDTMTAVITKEEHCDFCRETGSEVVALYDGKTTFGPWAFMCEDHYVEYGLGLGLGLGQALFVKQVELTETPDWC